MCTISLALFEGPLDLLLYLVERQDLDIRRINVAEVACQYLAYLRAMQELDLDLASEFLVLAVRLATIKARILLPRAGAAGGAVARGDATPEACDPRAELVTELTAYRECRRRAEALGLAAARQGLRFGRPSAACPARRGPVAGLGDAEVPAAALAGLYHQALRRLAQRTRVIPADVFTMRRRMAQLLRQLRLRGRALFSALTRGARGRGEVVVTLLALLELVRRRLVSLHQPAPFSDFEVGLRRAAAVPGGARADG